MDRDTVLDLIRYNEWANGRILDAIERLPPQQLTTPAALDHGTAWQTLLHLVDVEWSWRLIAQGIPAPQMLWEVETFADLAQLKAYWQSEHAMLRAYVQSLDDDTLNASLELGTTEDGLPKHAKRWHILAHLLNHSTQHRTELARYLTDCGHSPGDLDLLALLMGKMSERHV